MSALRRLMPQSFEDEGSLPATSSLTPATAPATGDVFAFLDDDSADTAASDAAALSLAAAVDSFSAAEFASTFHSAKELTLKLLRELTSAQSAAAARSATAADDAAAAAASSGPARPPVRRARTQAQQSGARDNDDDSVSDSDLRPTSSSSSSSSARVGSGFTTGELDARADVLRCTQSNFDQQAERRRRFGHNPAAGGDASQNPRMARRNANARDNRHMSRVSTRRGMTDRSSALEERINRLRARSGYRRVVPRNPTWTLPGRALFSLVRVPIDVLARAVHIHPRERAECAFFRFVVSDEYIVKHQEYLDAVQTFDPNELVHFTRAHPDHPEGLLQLSHLSESMGEFAPAGELTQRALAVLESCFPADFSLTSGNCRILLLPNPHLGLDPETAAAHHTDPMWEYSASLGLTLFRALARHAQVLAKAAAPRTALEFAKAALSLSPMPAPEFAHEAAKGSSFDPVCSLQTLDYYALRSAQWGWLARFARNINPVIGAKGNGSEFVFGPAPPAPGTAAPGAGHGGIATLDSVGRADSANGAASGTVSGLGPDGKPTQTSFGWVRPAFAPNWCFSLALAQRRRELAVVAAEEAAAGAAAALAAANGPEGADGKGAAGKKSSTIGDDDDNDEDVNAGNNGDDDEEEEQPVFPFLPKARSAVRTTSNNSNSGNSANATACAKKKSASAAAAEVDVNLTEDGSSQADTAAVMRLNLSGWRAENASCPVDTRLWPPHTQPQRADPSSAYYLQRALCLYPEVLSEMLPLLGAALPSRKVWAEVLEVTATWYTKSDAIARLSSVYAARCAGLWKGDVTEDMLLLAAQAVVRKWREGKWTVAPVQRLRDTLFPPRALLPHAVRMLQRADFTDETPSLPEELRRGAFNQMQDDAILGNSGGRAARGRRARRDEDWAIDIGAAGTTPLDPNSGLLSGLVRSLLPWVSAPDGSLSEQRLGEVDDVVRQMLRQNMPEQAAAADADAGADAAAGDAAAGAAGVGAGAGLNVGRGAREVFEALVQGVANPVRAALRVLAQRAAAGGGPDPGAGAGAGGNRSANASDSAYVGDGDDEDEDEDEDEQQWPDINPEDLS